MMETFNAYQVRATETLVQDDSGCPMLARLGLKLAGEAGEAADKIGKFYRDHDGRPPQQAVQDLAHELGDVLWYLAVIADCLGVRLGDIAKANLAKLKARAEQGKIRGEGDDR